MKKLELNQMESLQGGDAGCTISIIGASLAFIGLFALGPITGGSSWALAASWIAVGSTTGEFVASAAGIGASC